MQCTQLQRYVCRVYMGQVGLARKNQLVPTKKIETSVVCNAQSTTKVISGRHQYLRNKNQSHYLHHITFKTWRVKIIKGACIYYVTAVLNFAATWAATFCLQGFNVVYAVFFCDHTTGGEAYPSVTDGYGIFNIHTTLGTWRTHAGRSGTKQVCTRVDSEGQKNCTLTVPHQGIEPRLFGLEVRRCTTELTIFSLKW